MGSTAPAVTTYFAHKINNITSPAPGKPAPMVYPSTRRDSQGCPTKAEGRTIAKQCWASRPNPSGQRQEPCSHGPSRPAAVGAPAGQLRVRVQTASNAAQPVSIKPPFQSKWGHTPPSAQTRHNGRNKNRPRMSHSFRRNERQEASKHRQHSITKQTHRAPTDSNQSTYDPNARTPRQINVRPAPPPECPKLGSPWDILGHGKPVARISVLRSAGFRCCEKSVTGYYFQPK